MDATSTAALFTVVIGLVEVVKVLVGKLVNGKAVRNGAARDLTMDQAVLVLRQISESQERLHARLEADRDHLDSRFDRIEERIDRTAG